MRAEWETDPIVIGRASREFPVHKFSTNHIVPSLLWFCIVRSVLTITSLAIVIHDNTNDSLTTHTI
jgi:hypothetical protein